MNTNEQRILTILQEHRGLMELLQAYLYLTRPLTSLRQIQDALDNEEHWESAPTLRPPVIALIAQALPDVQTIVELRDFVAASPVWGTEAELKAKIVDYIAERQRVNEGVTFFAQLLRGEVPDFSSNLLLRSVNEMVEWFCVKAAGRAAYAIYDPKRYDDGLRFEPERRIAFLHDLFDLITKLGCFGEKARQAIAAVRLFLRLGDRQ